MDYAQIIDVISGAAIFVFGIGSVFLVGSPNPRRRRLGFICGVLQEPFWFYTTAYAGQWFIFASAFLYTYAWVRGLYNNWKLQ